MYVVHYWLIMFQLPYLTSSSQVSAFTISARKYTFTGTPNRLDNSLIVSVTTQEMSAKYIQLIH